MIQEQMLLLAALRLPLLPVYFFHLFKTMLSNLFPDDPSHPSAADPPAGAGEGAGALQGLLQQIHHLPQGQDAEREPSQESAPWTCRLPVNL